ncbi:hypothetical protein [Marinobacterium jannaschii]|uniref:hypothetical protein n=1 Tax=Marinobacterium jannaschii TaxID=64970 RepID=UPI0004872E43|nr:hypothetical protein [Marinobacterium jannaschii]
MKSQLLRRLGVCAGLLCLLLQAGSQTYAKERPTLPTGPIKLKLEEPAEMLRATYGKRGVWVTRTANSRFQARGAIWPLMGEPVTVFEFRSPHIRELTFEADAGYANRVTIHSLGDHHDDDYISSGFGEGVIDIYVSQKVLDRIEFSGFNFSIGTHSLSPLPDEFYSERNREDSYAISAGNNAYFHSPNPGILARPGQWGWDVPGSPDWGNFLSPFEHPLREGQYELPEDRRMDRRTAREAFRRMLWRHHVLKQDLIVNNWFDIQHLRINASRLLAFIYKKDPALYARINQREKLAKRDSQMVSLMSGLTRAGAESRDSMGTIVTTSDVVRRIKLIDKAFAAFDAEVGSDIKQQWRLQRQQYVDASYRRRLARLQSQLQSQDRRSGFSDEIKQTVASLKEDAARGASPALKQRIADVERLVNASPIIISSHKNGQRVKSRVITLKGRARMAANQTVAVRFNGAEQEASVNGDGAFSTKVVMKAGQNELEVCYDAFCTPLQLNAEIARLSLMATLTWKGGGDLDLHVETPDGDHCFYSDKRADSCLLDIDDTKGRNPENISIPTAAPTGQYRFWVVNYNGNRGARGELKLYRDGVLEQSREFRVDSSSRKTLVSLKVDH